MFNKPSSVSLSWTTNTAKAFDQDSDTRMHSFRADVDKKGAAEAETEMEEQMEALRNIYYHFIIQHFLGPSSCFAGEQQHT